MALTFTSIAQSTLYNFQSSDYASCKTQSCPSCNQQTSRYKDTTNISDIIGKVANEAYAELKAQGEFTRKSESTKSSNSDDEYWGIRQTSSRIVDFVLRVSEGNSEKFTIIKDAINKGFSDAKIASGGNLPDISYRTFEAVSTELDSWAAEAAKPNERV